MTTRDKYKKLRCSYIIEDCVFISTPSNHELCSDASSESVDK